LPHTPTVFILTLFSLVILSGTQWSKARFAFGATKDPTNGVL
jgi:hypothetical protein